MSEIVVGKVVDLTGRAVMTVTKIERKKEQPAGIDDDLRRLILSQLKVLKQRYPKDFKRIVLEVSEHVD